MPEIRVDFGPTLSSSNEQLAGAKPVAHNVVVDQLGCIFRRPGLVSGGIGVVGSHAGVPGNAVNGLHVTALGDVFAVTEQHPRQIVRVNEHSYHQFEWSLRGNKRPVFAETEALLVLAGGGRMNKVVFATEESSYLEGSPPAEVTHVVAHNTRLHANSLDINKTRVFYSSSQTGSSYAGHEDWLTGLSGSFAAEARPDPVTAVHENTNEVFVWGVNTLQVYTVDSVYDYVPLPTVEFGTVAPYTIVRVDQSFAWLDHQRRFILSDGRNNDVLSKPIQDQLRQLSTVDDAFGYRVQFGSFDMLVWTFPSEHVTYAYQQGGGWSMWTSWDATHQEWRDYPVTACVFDHARGNVLVGLTDGRLAAFSRIAQTDLNDPIRAYVTSGFMDCGTDKKKDCHLRLTLKRGQSGLAANERVGTLSWRDGLGTWESRPIELGEQGDSMVVLEYRSLGTFRKRQWRIEWAGNSSWSLAGATMDWRALE